MARRKVRSKRGRKTEGKTKSGKIRGKSKSKGGGRKGGRKGGYVVILGGRQLFGGEVFASKEEARQAIADAISGAVQMGDWRSANRYRKAKVKWVNKEPTKKGILIVAT